MPYLLGLFHWGAGRVSKLGQYRRRQLAKFIGLCGKCMLCEVLRFPFVNECTRAWVPTAQSVRRSFGGFRRNEWAVGIRMHTTQNLIGLHDFIGLILFFRISFQKYATYENRFG